MKRRCSALLRQRTANVNLPLEFRAFELLGPHRLYFHSPPRPCPSVPMADRDHWCPKEKIRWPQPAGLCGEGILPCGISFSGSGDSTLAAPTSESPTRTPAGGRGSAMMAGASLATTDGRWCGSAILLPSVKQHERQPPPPSNQPSLSPLPRRACGPEETAVLVARIKKHKIGLVADTRTMNGDNMW